jgi:hypothetical protein
MVMTHDSDVGQFAVVALLATVLIGGVVGFGARVLNWLLDLIF